MVNGMSTLQQQLTSSTETSPTIEALRNALASFEARLAGMEQQMTAAAAVNNQPQQQAEGRPSVSRQSSFGVLSRQLSSLESTLAPEALAELRSVVERLDNQVGVLLHAQQQQRALLESQGEILETKHAQHMQRVQAAALEATVRGEAAAAAEQQAQEAASAVVARLESVLSELTVQRSEVAGLADQITQLSCQVVAVNEGSADVEDVELMKESIAHLEERLQAVITSGTGSGAPVTADGAVQAAPAADEAATQVEGPHPDSARSSSSGGSYEEPPAAGDAALPPRSSLRRQRSTAGVLSAPLSLVVQLQAEVQALKSELVTREQLSALTRAVSTLRRSHACSEPNSEGGAGPAAAAPGTVIEGSATAAAVAAAASANAAAAAASSAADAADAVDRQTARLAAAEQQLAVLREAVEDACSRVSLLAAAAAQQASGPGAVGGAVGGRGGSAGGLDFSEVVPALANFKTLIEGQSAAIQGLQERVEGIEAVAQIVDAPRDEVMGRLPTTEAAASPQPSGALPPRIASTSAPGSRRASRTPSAHLAEEQATAAGALGRPISRSASSVVSATSEELAAAVVGPIGVVHRILIELKRRVEALESHQEQEAGPAEVGPTPALRRSSTVGGSVHRGVSTSVGGAEGVAGSADLLELKGQVAELQRLVETLQEQQQAAAKAPAAAAEDASHQAVDGAELAAHIKTLEVHVQSVMDAASVLQEQLHPVQAQLEATQRLAREVHVGQQQVIERLQVLEDALPISAVLGAQDADPAAAAAVAAARVATGAGAVRSLQEDLQALSRRITSCEVAAGQASAALAQVRRLTAKLADGESRASDVAGRVAALVGSSADGAARLAAAETRFRSKVCECVCLFVGGKVGGWVGELVVEIWQPMPHTAKHRSAITQVDVCRKVLDNLADQLTALGHMGSATGRASPTKNPLSGGWALATTPRWPGLFNRTQQPSTAIHLHPNHLPPHSKTQD